MKTIHYLSVVAITCLLAGQVNINAQEPAVEKKVGHQQRGERTEMKNDRKGGIPNLSEEQKTKIKELRLAHAKETQPLHNQMGELRAKQRTLSTAEKADMKLINANIDEISKVQNLLMKSGAQLNQLIRALLTDEQRISFDTKKGGKMKHIAKLLKGRK
jgi:Spy/CpxP family protein refolding chaperone